MNKLMKLMEPYYLCYDYGEIIESLAWGEIMPSISYDYIEVRVIELYLDITGNIDSNLS